MENKDGNKENNMWRLAGEIFFIFGLPAIIAGVISSQLEKGKIFVLGTAFFLSWALFIYKYKKIIK